MTTPRRAHSLQTLLGQINDLAPNRSKVSDGWIGDPAHAARKSDHNPDENGIVNALDITHDPRGGMDGEAFSEALRDAKDSRIKYVIWNRRIMSGKDGPSPWQWRKYDGSNPHTKHVHISVNSDADAPWRLPYDAREDKHAEPAMAVLRIGDRGDQVARLQKMLNSALKIKLRLDGDFGVKTDAAVRKFQEANALLPDGIVGPYTWDALS